MSANFPAQVPVFGGRSDSTPPVSLPDAEAASVHAAHRLGAFVERGASGALFVGDTLFGITRDDGQVGPNADPHVYVARDPGDHHTTSITRYIVDPETGRIVAVAETGIIAETAIVGISEPVAAAETAPRQRRRRGRITPVADGS